eukprot:scaffold38324_cov31-Attheya_sp.AAC.1
MMKKDPFYSVPSEIDVSISERSVQAILLVVVATEVDSCDARAMRSAYGAVWRVGVRVFFGFKVVVVDPRSCEFWPSLPVG